MSIFREIASLYQFLSDLVTQSGIVYTSINLSLRFNRTDLDLLSFSWIRKEQERSKELNPVIKIQETLFRLSKYLAQMELQPHQGVLTIFTGEFEISALVRDQFEVMAKNCIQSSSKTGGTEFTIQIISPLL